MKILINENQVKTLKMFIKENQTAGDESLVSELITHAERVVLNSPNSIQIEKETVIDTTPQDGLNDFLKWVITIRSSNNETIQYVIKPESFVVKRFSLGSEPSSASEENFIISSEFSKKIQDRIKAMDRTKGIKQKQHDEQKNKKSEFVKSIVGSI